MDNYHPTLSESAPETADRIEVSTSPSPPLTGLSSSRYKLSTPTIVPEQLNKNLNSIPPINQLPTEILITILEESTYVPELSQSDIPHIQKLQGLASVCLAWSRIIKDTPRLWSVVESTAPKELVPIILRKSGQCTLTFKCHYNRINSPRGVSMDEEGGRPWDELKSFLAIAFSELHRWRSALLHLSPPEEEILWGLEQPAPSIERVDIKIDDWPWRAVNLFSGHAPNLRWVHIVGLPFMWSQGVFHDLRHLHIVSIMLTHLTVEDILLTLQSSPNLQTFCLGYIKMPIAQTPPNFSAFRLEFLETLQLLLIPPSVIHPILAHIHAPILHHLTINPDHENEDFDSLRLIDTAIDHFLPMDHFNLGDPHTVKLSLRRDSVSVRIVSDSRHPRDCIAIQISHNSSAHTVQTCLETMIHSSPPNSRMVLTIMDIPRIAWSDLGGVLSSLDEVVELDIWDLQLGHIAGLVKFLSTPLDVCGVQKWPFPKLAQMILPSTISGEQAVQLVRARYDSSFIENGAAAQGRVVPCSLAILDVSDVFLEPEQFSEITRILGRTVVRRGSETDEESTYEGADGAEG